MFVSFSVYAFENELKPSSKNVTEGLVDKK